MADGTGKTDTLNPPAVPGGPIPGPATIIAADSFCPALSLIVNGNDAGIVWQSGVTTSGSATPALYDTERTYLWGSIPRGIGAGQQFCGAAFDPATELPIFPYTRTYPFNDRSDMSWTTGPMGFALKEGAKARPVAWGFRIRYAGLQNTITNINPYGKIYFGICAPESEGDLPGSVDFDTHPFYDGIRQADGSVNGGPGNQINMSSLANDATLNKVGCITMQQLAALPNGIVVGTGARSTDERQFRDVDYYAGQDRVTGQPSNNQADQFMWPLIDSLNPVAAFKIGVNQVSTLQGNQPWFIVQDGINVTLEIDYICHWEVTATTEAYTLPGTLQSTPANARVMDDATNLIHATARNPMGSAVRAAGLG